MARPRHQCQACGRYADEGEVFQLFRVASTAVKAHDEHLTETLLCPHCAAPRQQAGELQLAYRFCHVCAGPIEPGSGDTRWKTETNFAGGTVAGGQSFQNSVALFMCPRCLSEHDGTAGWLVMCLAILLGALILFVAVSRWVG
jgi:rubredoxin